MFTFNSFVLFSMIWMVVLFAVLPVGTQADAAPDGSSGWRGAPAAPRMWRKAAITTLIALAVWGGAELVIQSDWLSFRHGILAEPAE